MSDNSCGRWSRQFHVGDTAVGHPPTTATAFREPLHHQRLVAVHRSKTEEYQLERHAQVRPECFQIYASALRKHTHK
jgi:hypothetical protein